MRAVAVVATLFLMTGCASTVPKPIRDAPVGAPSPGVVRADPDAYHDAAVRWGGTIVSVTNKAEFTELELVARPLDDSGRPRPVDRSLGRFLARVPGFLDPAVYERGRLLTVVGVVSGVQERSVGEYPYRFPVVAVDGHHLWPKRTPVSERPYPYDPYGYDPWYPRSMFHPYCPYGVSPRYCW